MIERIKSRALNLTLIQRFMLGSFVILLAAMVGIGAWVESQVETGVIHRTGAATALYVDSFVAPTLQELGRTGSLSPESTETLGTLLADTPMGQQIVAFRVWDPRGRLLYSTDESTVGITYPMHEGLLRARLGEVVSSVSELEDEENAPLGAVHDHLLETYSPVWLSGTSEIIAVAEFYQLTDDLEREIGILKRRSRLVVGLAILLVYLLLSGFVRRAGDTINAQQVELERRVKQLTTLLSQNQELHERVRRAAASVAQLNESYLGRIGSELHDGPAQDLGLSILKLDAVIARIEAHPMAEAEPALQAQLTEVEHSLQSALNEMRAIAAGLSLPQLSELDLRETVVRAVRRHERRTGAPVELQLENLPAGAALPLKITLYRLVQEALNNAFRHAGGQGQQVRVMTEQDQIVVEIADRGPGFDPERTAGRDGRLGLNGMRERVESLGGNFSVESRTGEGTRVFARIPCRPEEGGGQR